MILAHDLGTTGDKAALFTDAGELVAARTIAYPTDFGPGGKAEQSPYDWWDAFCRSTRELLDHTGTDPDVVSCVSFSGQMMGAVFLDASGEPVRPAIIWADTRSHQQEERLVARVGMRQGYAITGHRLNSTYSLTKVAWTRENEPGAFASARAIVQAKDYLAYRLTGTLVTDPSDASSTNAFDQRTGQWSPEMLAAADLPGDMLPEVVPSTTVIGTVRPSAADASGLATGTRVVIGGGDGPCAATGAGVVSPESGAYAYLGSSSWVSLAAEEPLYDPEMRTITFNHVVPGRFVPTAPMQAGGASLEWVVDVLSPGDGSSRYEELLQSAAGVTAAADGLFFLPHLLGERSPYWNAKARAVFAGLARHHDRPHLVRAVLEGVAFNLYTGLLAFRENGSSLPRVDAIGGGAVGDTVLGILADVWGVPVRRRSVVEANVLGAAIVGGVGAGLFDGFDVAPTLSQVEWGIDPDPDAHESYRHCHELFLDAYRRMEPWFDAF